MPELRPPARGCESCAERDEVIAGLVAELRALQTESAELRKRVALLELRESRPQGEGGQVTGYSRTGRHA